MLDKEISANMLSAIIKDLSAQEASAIATIQLLLNNSAGIASHSDVLGEIKKWAKVGADAKGAKDFLIERFTTTVED